MYLLVFKYFFSAFKCTFFSPGNCHLGNVMNLSVCIPVQMSSGVHTGVSVDLNTQTGGTVNAPVITGNTITGPVTFNYSTARLGTVTVTVPTETHCLLAVSEIMLSVCEP